MRIQVKAELIDATRRLGIPDILRLWRTFCVNYEARTSKEPIERKAKRKLKNYKLKYSRLLTCYSALAYLLAVFIEKGSVAPQDASQMVRFSPTERLEWLAQRSFFATRRSKTDQLLRAYETFLKNTDSSEEELVQKFMTAESSRMYFQQANDFGDQMYDLLKLIGEGTRFHRLLTV